MALLNYTTEVAVEKTLGEIQTMLMKAGAQSILLQFSLGKVEAVSFTVMTAYGVRPFRLPADTSRVQAVLRRERVQARFQTPEQAERVAWRILKDWLEAQLALVKVDLVTLDQVMLSFMQDEVTGQTVYEAYRDRQLALPSGQ
jgi:hypothetical protein